MGPRVDLQAAQDNYIPPARRLGRWCVWVSKQCNRSMCQENSKLIKILDAVTWCTCRWLKSNFVCKSCWKSFRMWISSLASVLCSLDLELFEVADHILRSVCRMRLVFFSESHEDADTHACTHTNLYEYMHKHTPYPYEHLRKIKYEPIIFWLAWLAKPQWALHCQQHVAYH